MAPPETSADVDSADLSVRLERSFNAGRGPVFHAFLRPETLRLWWGPEGFTAESIEVDARVGGRFRFAFKAPDGAVHAMCGEYREIRPPEKLVFTWFWEGSESAVSLVTIDLHDAPGGTRLALVHEGLPTKESRESHTWGWNSGFNKLAQAIDKGEIT